MATTFTHSSVGQTDGQRSLVSCLSGSGAMTMQFLQASRAIMGCKCTCLQIRSIRESHSTFRYEIAVKTESKIARG